jgi:Icc protein
VGAKRLAWLTDAHLDHASPAACEDLWSAIRASRADVLLLGGDTGTAETLERRLLEVRDRAGLPVYFVLGNHDCYGGSIAGARALARRLTAMDDGLTWMGAVDVVPLSDATALIGHDGWGDGGFGNAVTTPVVLNDFLLIDELRTPRRAELLRVLRELGEESAAHLRRTSVAAAEHYANLVVLMHVAPFRQAAWHEGRESDPDFLPFFVCRAAGEALVEVMERHRGATMTALCGHTHGGGRCSPMERLTVITGGAEYGVPALQPAIEVP